MQALEPAPGILVINDAAEATPLTTANALKVLAELALELGRARAVLVAEVGVIGNGLEQLLPRHLSGFGGGTGDVETTRRIVK